MCLYSFEEVHIWTEEQSKVMAIMGKKDQSQGNARTKRKSCAGLGRSQRGNVGEHPAHTGCLIRSKATVLSWNSDGLGPGAAGFDLLLISSVPHSSFYFRRSCETPGDFYHFDGKLMHGALHRLPLILIKTLKVSIFTSLSLKRSL